MITKKLFSLILCSVLLIGLCGCDIFFPNNTTTTAPVSETQETTIVDPYPNLTTAEKLSTVGRWEMENNPYNVMVFNADGTGFNINFGITYASSWELDGDIMTKYTEITKDDIQTTVYKLTMGSNYFIITNVEHNTSGKFYIEGTQPREVPADGVKDTKLFGVWIPDDSAYNSYLFNDDGEMSGSLTISGSNAQIKKEFKWTVYNYELYVYYVNGAQYRYEYVVSGNKLTLYSEGRPNVTYTKANTD